ncbi:MAG: hypothetical protein AAFR98_10950 [Pseudomonadota bacterium]
MAHRPDTLNMMRDELVLAVENENLRDPLKMGGHGMRQAVFKVGERKNRLSVHGRNQNVNACLVLKLL